MRCTRPRQRNCSGGSSGTGAVASIGSGGVNSEDFFAFLRDFFGGRADVDNSGGTDSRDFFVFVVGFFGGC